MTMGQNQSNDGEEVELSQINDLYIAFMKKCPSGALHLHEFRNLFGVQSSSEEEAQYMERIFRSFDTNGDNVIDFMEFVAAVHLVLRGKLEDRLSWSFKIFDRDNNGKLDRYEVQQIIWIISKIKKNNPDMSPSQICERIFALVDQNNDGQISLAEFIDGAQRDIWIMDTLKLEVNAVAWFKEHWKPDP